MENTVRNPTDSELLLRAAYEGPLWERYLESLGEDSIKATDKRRKEQKKLKGRATP